MGGYHRVVKTVQTPNVSVRNRILATENTLLLLVDTGAGVSLFKPYNLDKTRHFDPKVRVKVKSVTIETMGAVQAFMYEKNTVYISTC